MKPVLIWLTRNVDGRCFIVNANKIDFILPEETYAKVATDTMIFEVRETPGQIIKIIEKVKEHD